MQSAARQLVNRPAPTPKPAASAMVHTAVAIGRVQRDSALKVSSPNDPAEQEAERVARTVVGMSGPDRTVPVAGAAASQTGAPLVLRQADGGGPVPADAATGISALRGSGAPLPARARQFMEPRFGASFANVRVHTGEQAARLNRRLDARAFTVGSDIFFGRGRFQPDDPKGRELLAHELTHTIQQGAVVARAAQTPVTQRSAPRVQRSVLSRILDYFADKAHHIPGFRMFTLVIGVNPINMERVERTAANFLRALVELLPGGHLITQALDNHGVFDRAAAIVEQRVVALGLSGSAIKKSITDFIDSLGWSDALSPGDVWDNAKQILLAPIRKLIDLGTTMIGVIVDLVKNAILRPLALLAEGKPAYDLLKAVLGEDPITGDKITPTPDLLIGGFMKLIGQEELWNNIKKANAIPRAWAWFKNALAGVVALVRGLPGRFIATLKSLELADIILVPRAFVKVGQLFVAFVVDFVTWAGNAVWNLLEIVFEVVAPAVMPYLRKAQGAFRTILRAPGVFVGHLVRAGKQGFMQFADGILGHLKNALIRWLMGPLGEMGVYMPQSLSFVELLKLVLSVLGLTWANLRGKLVKVVGEPTVKALETGFALVVTFVKEGPAAAWEEIKQHIADFKQTVVDEIQGWVVTTVVKRAVTKLVSMLTPAGAFIQAVLAIYDTVMFFVTQLKQIARVAAAFIDSISAIAAGVVKTAADRVESTLAGLLSLAIAFLAQFAGLGKASTVIKGIIEKIRAPIDKAMDKVVEWVVGLVKKAGKFLAQSARKLLNWGRTKSAFVDADNKTHHVQVENADTKPRLAVRSDPQTVRSFVDIYLKNKTPEVREKRSALVQKIHAAANASEKLIDDIDKATAEGKSEAVQNDLLQKLLLANVTLSEVLSQLIGRSPLDMKQVDIYKLEGMTGTFSSIPKPVGDSLTADHQPQAAILEAAKEFKHFNGKGKWATRGGNRAALGYAINLHSRRHAEGLTFKNDGKKTKAAFMARAEKYVNSSLSPIEQQRAVVKLIREDLTADARRMIEIATSHSSDRYWGDVRSLDLGDAKKNEALIQEIGGRIVAGERQMMNQPLDELVGE